MGRLFWKILAGFWLALLLAVLGVGAGLLIREEARRTEESALAAGPRSSYVLRTVWTVARHGGEPALRSYFAAWPEREGEPPLVVSPAGTDLLGRPVPVDALRAARDWLDEREGQVLPGSDPRWRRVRSWRDETGADWLMFFPQSAARVPERPPAWRDLRLDEGPVLLALAALIASLLVSAVLARHFSRPIRRLQEAFKAASQGELSVRVSAEMRGRRDEIGVLGHEFDGMAQHLQQLVGSQSRLLHDVSHELRSPLARLQVAVGLARQRPEQLETALARIERESERLDALVGEVLTLSRLEAQTQQGDADYVDLVELLDSVVEDARFEAEGSGRTVVFTHEIDGELVIRARGELLHRAVDNLVRNALRHTPPESEVSLSLSCDVLAKVLKIVVADSGPGVSAPELERIFEPFHRGEGAGGGGYGLGLAIARRAIEAHGGSLKACNRSAGGLEVQIELPLRRPGV